MTEIAASSEASGHSDRPVEHRVVVLGASNVMRGLSTVVRTARSAFPTGQLDMLLATGHGRSYHLHSRVLARTLPGILDCQLWNDLKDRPAAKVSALITDVGNDILYQATPTQILRWIEQAVHRLQAVEANVVITGLPLDGINELAAIRFRILKAILFPSSPLTLEKVRNFSHELNDGLRQLCEAEHCDFITPLPTWYGIDPIHVKMRFWNEAWTRYFSAFQDAKEIEKLRSAPMIWAKLRTMRPHQRWMFGRSQSCAQPAGSLINGTTLSFY